MIQEFDDVFAQKPGLRHVNRAKLVDAELLADVIPRGGPFPSGPVIGMRADTPMDDAFASFGMHSVEGCTMLFFDVFAGDEYFCNVASANDPFVFAAMKVWLKAGIVPVWMRRQDGRNDFALQPFSLGEMETARSATTGRIRCSVWEWPLRRSSQFADKCRLPSTVPTFVSA